MEGAGGWSRPVGGGRRAEWDDMGAGDRAFISFAKDVHEEGERVHAARSSRAPLAWGLTAAAEFVVASGLGEHRAVMSSDGMRGA